MADIYRLQGQAEQALQCAQQAIKLGQRSEDSSREAKGLEYLGLTYTFLGEYDKAINHVRLAESYLHLSNSDKALFHVEQACKNLQYLAPFDRKMVLAGFSNVLLDLGRYMQSFGKQTEAIAYAKLAMELAEEAKSNGTLQAATYLLQQLEPHISGERAG